MPLELTLTGADFEKVDDAAKPFYIKADDGSYRLDANVEDTSGLKSALQKERDRADAAEKQYKETVKKYKDIDPEKAAAAQAKLDELEQKELEAAREWETLKERAKREKEEAIAAATAPLTEKLTKREQRLRDELIASRIKSEAVTQGIIEPSLDLFTELASRYVDLAIDDDGESPISIKDGLGTNIAELVTNLKNQPAFGTFFKADVPPGSGAPQSKLPTGSLPPNTKKKSEMSTKEKAAYVTTYGGQSRKNPDIPCLSELPE